jgi:hypothetical protein
MPDISQGNHANLILAPGDTYTISTVGVAQVVAAYGAPAGTTTITAGTQTFGPYGVPAKLRVNATTGTASYAFRSVFPMSIAADGKPDAATLAALAAGGVGSSVPLSNVISVLTKDVISHPTQDQTIAIQTALNAIAAMGKQAYFPEGVYCYSAVIAVPCGIYGDGLGKSELRCISATGATSLWDVSGLSGFVARGLYWNSINCTGYVNNETAGHLRLFGCDRYEVTHNWFRKAGSAAYLARSCSNGWEMFNRLRGIWHDGLHHTRACSNINVLFNYIEDGGDDMIAVVGYKGDNPSMRPRKINIAHNILNGSKYARGVAVVGGEDCPVYGNQISKTAGAGIYICSELGAYGTFGDDNITVTDNTLDGCGVNSVVAMTPAKVFYNFAAPAILIQGYNGADSRNIKIKGNTIKNSANGGIVVGGQGGYLIDGDINGNHIIDTWDPYNKNGITLSSNADVTAQATIPCNTTACIGVGMVMIDPAGSTPMAGYPVTAVTATSVTVSGGTVTALAGTSFVFTGGGLNGVTPNTSAASASGEQVLRFAATSGLIVAGQTIQSCVSVGMSVSGTNVPAGAYVQGVDGTTVTISAPLIGAVASGATITFGRMTYIGSTSFSTNAATASGNVLPFAATSGVAVGQGVSGSGIAAGTYVQAFTGTSVTLSQPISAAVGSGVAISFQGSPTAAGMNAISIYAATNTSVKENRISRCGGYGLFINNSFSALLDVEGNKGADISMAFGYGRFITVNGLLGAGQLLRLKNNYMQLPSNWPRSFDSFIFCDKANYPYVQWHEDNRVQNNAVGFNVNGTATVPITLTVGASPFTYVNNNPCAVLVWVTGGTVSDISIQVTAYPMLSTGQTSGMFLLKPFESLKVTYSAAPTMTMVPRLGQ